MEILNKLISYFANDGLVAFLTFVLSIVAILLSISSLISSRSANRKIIDIEKTRDKKAEDSEKKALLSASPLRESRSSGKGVNNYLVVKNSGISEAKDISISFDGSTGHKYLNGKSHIPVLGPNTTKKVPLFVTLDTSSPEEVGLSWINADGTEGNYKTAY